MMPSDDPGFQRFFSRVSALFWIIVLGAIISAILAVSSRAQSTKAQLNTEVTTNYPDNTTGAITPAILRTTTNDMISSWQQAPIVNAQTGTTYTFLVGDYGKLVTFSNSGAIAVTLPQATGSFTTWNSYVKNLGAGAVTITPTTSTINGSSSLVLPSGGSIWIVSDGANYQVYDSSPSVLSVLDSTKTTSYHFAVNDPSSVQTNPLWIGAGLSPAAGNNPFVSAVYGQGVMLSDGTATERQMWNGPFAGHTWGAVQAVSASQDTVFQSMRISDSALSGGNLTSIVHFSGTHTPQPTLNFISVRGAPFPGSSTALQNNDVIGVIGYFSFDGSVYAEAADMGLCRAAEVWTAIAHGVLCDFSTTPIGSITKTNAVRIQASGGVSIGSLTDPGVGGLLLAGTETFADSSTWGTTGISNSHSYSTVSTSTLNWSPTWNFSSTANGINSVLFGPTLVPTGASAGNINAINYAPTIGTSAVNIGLVRGFSATLTVNSGYTGVMSNIIGFRGGVTNSGTNSIASAIGIQLDPLVNGNGITSGSISNIQVLLSASTNAAGSGGTVANDGLKSIVSTGSGAGTTVNRGIYITGNGGSGGLGTTTNFALFSDSTAASQMTGDFTDLGTIRANTGFNANGSSGVSTTCTVTAGNSYVFTFGLLTTKGANCT